MSAAGGDQTKVGFIGLGTIGAPMAERLVDWPGGLVVFDLRAEATDPFAEKGATVAGSVAGMAEDCGLIQVMVQTDDQVRSVAAEILPVAAPGTVVALHSTIDASTAQDLAEQAAPHEVEIVDAPVSGGWMGALAGNLAVMVGGTEQAVDVLRGPFSCWAELIVHAGPTGAGTRMKLARNLITYAGYGAAIEGARLAEAAGLSMKDLGDVVRHSDSITGGPGAIMVRESLGVIDPDDGLHEPFLHARVLGEKDLELAASLGDQVGTELPYTQLTRQRLADDLGVPHEAGG